MLRLLLAARNRHSRSDQTFQIGSLGVDLRHRLFPLVAAMGAEIARILERAHHDPFEPHHGGRGESSEQEVFSFTGYDFRSHLVFPSVSYLYE